VIGIEHYIVVSAMLFVLGVLGIFFNRKNIIVIWSDRYLRCSS